MHIPAVTQRRDSLRQDPCRNSADSRAELMERGREIGWDRVIAGVHRPSDIAAGRTVGEAITNALLDSKEFQQELAATKAEFEEVKHEQRDFAPAGAR